MIFDRSAQPLDALSPPANGNVIDDQLRGSRPYVAFGSLAEVDERRAGRPLCNREQTWATSFYEVRHKPATLYALAQQA